MNAVQNIRSVEGGILDEPVSEWMTQPVRTLHEQDRLEIAWEWMEQLSVSALPVVNGTGRIAGVLSRTDLLRVGRMRGAATTRRRALVLPDARVREHMSSPVELISPDLTLQKAARQMVRRKVHRLYVADDRVPRGVVSTLDIVDAVGASGNAIPVDDIASERLVSIQCREPVSLAVDRLVASRHSVLLVLDGEWPVGLFGAEEALAARDAPAQSPVDEWSTAGFVCVSGGTPLHRAADRIVDARPRCVLVTEGPEVRGIVTAMDFVRALAAGG